MKDLRFVIFFDIDGTLYDHGKGVPETTMDTLRQLKEEGFVLCLNTGRAKNFIPEALLSFPFDGIVAGNGAYVEYHNEILQDIIFPETFTRFIYDEFLKKEIPLTLEAKNDCYMSAAMAEHTLKRFSRWYPDSEHSQAVRLTGGSFQIRDNLEQYSFDNLVHKYSFYGTEENLGMIKRLFEGKAVLSLEAPDSFGYIYGEAVPAGCCKSSGAAVLCCFAGISYDRVAAIGDGSNDVDLIRWAKHGIVMGNAEDSLKQYADFVCRPLLEGGICDVPGYLAHVL